ITYTGYDSNGPVNHQTTLSAWGGYMPAYLLNEGTVNCYEPVPVIRAAAPDRSPDYQGEGHPSETTGKVTLPERTPNTLRIAAHLDKPGLVVLNQNFFPGWQTNVGKLIGRDDLMAVRLLAGDHDIRLKFAPRSFYAGAAVTGCTLIIAAVSLLF